MLCVGNILMSMKKYTEALDHFREANEIAPDRYESYAGLAEAHIAVRRPRQAVAVSIECCRQFSNSPRALTVIVLFFFYLKIANHTQEHIVYLSTLVIYITDYKFFKIDTYVFLIFFFCYFHDGLIV